MFALLRIIFAVFLMAGTMPYGSGVMPRAHALIIYTFSNSAVETPAAAAAVLLSSAASPTTPPIASTPPTAANPLVTLSINADDVHNGLVLASETQSSSTVSTGIGVVNASVSVPSLNKTHIGTSAGTAIAATTAVPATSSAPSPTPSKPWKPNVKIVLCGVLLIIAFSLVMYIQLRAYLNHSRSSHNGRRGPTTTSRPTRGNSTGIALNPWRSTPRRRATGDQGATEDVDPVPAYVSTSSLPVVIWSAATSLASFALPAGNRASPDAEVAVPVGSPPPYSQYAGSVNTLPAVPEAVSDQADDSNPEDTTESESSPEMGTTVLPGVMFEEPAEMDDINVASR